MKHGDFTGLAEKYALYRPGYSRKVIDQLVQATGKPSLELDVADVGAGTGILTRQLMGYSPRRMVAIEPNVDMLEQGQKHGVSNVEWVLAGAEQTGMEDSSFDLVTMASSFHWPETLPALNEFVRILRPEGVFSALWNPRLTERSSVESLVDKILEDDFGVTSRVSSGRGEFANGLSKSLSDFGLFSKIMYLESVDIKAVEPKAYLGAWESVNDIQSQLGEDAFTSFINRVKGLVRNVDSVDVHYLTRCWIARI